MTIVENVIWQTALAGGALIGLASASLLLLNGKIAGISGILGGLLKRQNEDFAWRFCFILGLVIGGAIISFYLPSNTMLVNLSTSSKMMVAGLLVGFGTTLGSGCTVDMEFVAFLVSLNDLLLRP